MDQAKRSWDDISSPNSPDKMMENSKSSKAKIDIGSHEFIQAEPPKSPKSTVVFIKPAVFTPSVSSTCVESQPSGSSQTQQSPVNVSKQPEPSIGWLCNAFTKFQSDVSIKLEKLDKIDQLVTDFNHVNEVISHQSVYIEKLREDNQMLKQKVSQFDLFKQKVIDLELYTKRNNLIIEGIKPPTSGETPLSLKGAFYDILHKMGLPDVEHISIETIHRLGRKLKNKIQPVIVRFVKFCDRQAVWGKRFDLKGSGLWLKEHVPDTVENERQLLQPYFKKAVNLKLKPKFVKNTLEVDGKKITTSNLQDLPESINVNNVFLQGIDGIVYISDKANPLSNDFPADMSVEGYIFSSVEQFVNYRKAEVYGDTQAAENVLKTDLPFAQRACTKHLTGSADWIKLVPVVFGVALRCKFKQNSFHSDLLISTGEATLAYVSTSKVMGIGLAPKDDQRFDRSKWTGENELGKLLMKIRHELVSPISGTGG